MYAYFYLSYTYTYICFDIPIVMWIVVVVRGVAAS